MIFVRVPERDHLSKYELANKEFVTDARREGTSLVFDKNKGLVMLKVVSHYRIHHVNLPGDVLMMWSKRGHWSRAARPWFLRRPLPTQSGRPDSCACIVQRRLL